VVEVSVYRDKGEINASEVHAFEKHVGCTLPKSYVSLISKHNGLEPEKCIFRYQLNGKEFEGDINFFAFGNGLKKYESILNAQKTEGIPRFFVIFGHAAGGDFVGFSYKSKQCNEPVIAVLLHDAFDDYGIMKEIEVAKDFEAFVSGLLEDDE
jgi:hypothetical protein